MDFDATEIEAATARERSRFTLPLVLGAALAGAFLWSADAPEDPVWWWTQAAPVVAGVGVLVATAKRFPLTRLCYLALALMGASLLVGSHYAGAALPAGARIQAAMQLGQNPFLALVRLVEGFALALLAREVLLRKSPLQPGRWLATLAVASSLAVFDLLAIAVRGVMWFFGIQGARLGALEPVGEAALVLCGAALALLTCQRVHDAQLIRIWLHVTRAIDWRRV